MFKESQLIKSKGFTLIEALVSLALFAIAFSGLYLFFGMAQQANNNSEKKMYLNLMANQILETITAETARSDTDALNPFKTPDAYNADLSDCATYTAPDVRQTWCSELNASVGPHKGVHADEVRTIEVAKDGDHLIVDVALTVDDGSGSTNLVKAYFTRKIRPQRRPDQTPEACIERHNILVNFIKEKKAGCVAGDITQFGTNLYGYFRGVRKETTWNTGCRWARGYSPTIGWMYNLYYTGRGSGVGFTYPRPGFRYSVETQFAWGGGRGIKKYRPWGFVDQTGLAQQFWGYARWQMDADIYSPGTIYGTDYSWGNMADITLGFGPANKIWNANGNDGEPGTMAVVMTDWPALCEGHPKAKCGFTINDAHLSVVSCCPTEKLASGKFKQCGVDYKSRSDRSPFLVDTIVF